MDIRYIGSVILHSTLLTDQGAERELFPGIFRKWFELLVIQIPVYVGRIIFFPFICSVNIEL